MLLSPVLASHFHFPFLFCSGGKLGGWVAENYVGFAKVMKWFYSDFHEVTPDAEYADLDTPQENWYREGNELWMKARGIPGAFKMSAPELSKFVRDLIANDEAPPLLSDTCCAVEDVQRMTVALSAMISRLMGKEVSPDSIADAEQSIKVSPLPRAAVLHHSAAHLPSFQLSQIFLSAHCIVQDTVNSRKKKPEWISKYNYLCLLNLLETMEKFGPLPSFWEGKIQGEGIVPFIKAEMSLGMRPGWQIRLLTKLMKRRAMLLVTGGMVDFADDATGEEEAAEGAPIG